MKNLLLFTLLFMSFQYLSFSQTIEVITQEQSKGIIKHLTYSPDGSLLASGSESDPVIKIWDIKSGKIIGKLYTSKSYNSYSLYSKRKINY